VDGKSVYDKLRQPKFHLLTFSDGQSDYVRDSPGQPGEIQSKDADLIDHYVLPLYPHAAEAFGANQSFSVLLRPDNYIGFISSETSSDRLATYLTEAIGNGS
jgi:hypothetical protein